MTQDTAWGGMDPNSRNQVWSHWTFTVRAHRHRVDPLSVERVKVNVARFVRHGFGTAGEMRLSVGRRGTDSTWRFEVRCEGAPVQDPQFRDHVRASFEKFMRAGFGASFLRMDMEASLLAGDAQDGTPPAQLIVLESLIPAGTVVPGTVD